MSEKVHITITGEVGKVDGYLETMLGLIGLSGVFDTWEISRGDAMAGLQTLYIDAVRNAPLPLGHIGVQDIPLRKPALTAREVAVNAALNFRDMVRDHKYLVLDTETTGLETGEIVQISVLNQDGEVLMYELVKPTLPIPLEATAIHGITNQRVANARRWGEVSADLEKLLKGQNVVIYNATYDRKMMHQSAEFAGLPRVDWKSFCTFYCAMETFAVIYGQWNEYRQSYRWQKLSTAADYFDVEVLDAHDALGDCMTTLAICKHISLFPTIV